MLFSASWQCPHKLKTPFPLIIRCFYRSFLLMFSPLLRGAEMSAGSHVNCFSPEEVTSRYPRDKKENILRLQWQILQCSIFYSLSKLIFSEIFNFLLFLQHYLFQFVSFLLCIAVNSNNNPGQFLRYFSQRFLFITKLINDTLFFYVSPTMQ